MTRFIDIVTEQSSKWTSLFLQIEIFSFCFVLFHFILLSSTILLFIPILPCFRLPSWQVFKKGKAHPQPPPNVRKPHWKIWLWRLCTKTWLRMGIYFLVAEAFRLHAQLFRFISSIYFIPFSLTISCTRKVSAFVLDQVILTDFGHRNNLSFYLSLL